MKIRLCAIRRNIECTSQTDQYRFVLWRVLYDILPDKLLQSVRIIALVGANSSRRQWNSQTIFLAVFRLYINIHFFIAGLTESRVLRD